MSAGKAGGEDPREGIREILISNQTWPLSDYITARGIPDELLRKYPWNRHSGRESLRENIVCMTEDDDLNYPMINLWVLENYGRDFRSEDVAEAWLTLMPVLACFTAERVAYLNSLALLTPPETAWVNNPYREWIGAQIRADIWGWVCPGDPRRAAALAWRDARLSHVRNGIYGEMFFAALIAAAFRLDNPVQLLRAGLRQIPRPPAWRMPLILSSTCTPGSGISRRRSIRFITVSGIITGCIPSTMPRLLLPHCCTAKVIMRQRSATS